VEIDESKIEAKARRLLRAEVSKRLEQGRVKSGAGFWAAKELWGV